MPDQDNVSTEKISLTFGDFDENQGRNDFGIQETQLLATKDLESFLFSNPDDIKSVKEDEELEENQQKPQQKDPPKPKEQKEESNQQNNKQKTLQQKEEERDANTKAFENFLLGEEEDDNQKSQGEVQDLKEATQSSDDETYATLSKDLLRLGVFSKNSDDETEENINIKTPEEFLERFGLEKKKGAINILENFLVQFGEDRRKMFDAIFVNGVEPQEYLQSFSKIEAIGNINIEEESNQERVVRAYYRQLKWDDNKIDTRIQKLKDYGDLEDEAKTYHEVLLNKERENIAELEKKKIEENQKNKEKEVSQKKSYQKILGDKLKAQELDGIPLTEKDAIATLEYLTDKKYKLQSGELLSEFDKDLLELNKPENHELKVKLGLLLRKKLDLTSVKKNVITKKSENLFNLSTKNVKQNPKEKEIKSFF